MEQHTGSQYDDDLTVGIDEYDSLQTSNVDLFEFVSDEESPITRLKTLILSIDWEISDDILRQFNIELLDLKDIWANDKINLVYVQALEKISKYIFQEKANANPNAIKLLMNFYSNLEKIVSTESMPEEEKKRLLMEDVEKFEKLKKQIARSSGKTQVKKTTDEAAFTTAPAFRMDEPLPTGENEDPLLNLKAIVFGMDWEITEADLNNLGDEVRRLEKRFSNSKAKLIFLQGIGALGAYINLKRSNAHADAFKLLHSFFLSLENCVRNGLTGEEEKRLLMPEVEKFNAFKAAIAFTLSPEAIVAEGEKDEDISADSSGAGSDLAPAFADLPEEVHGFQEEEEAASLGSDARLKVDGQIERFFDNGKAPSEKGEEAGIKVNAGKSDLIGEMESRLQGFFGDESTMQQIGGTDGETALKGVIVETEADDDSTEEALPRLGDELAPALSENFEESSFSEKAIAGELGEAEILSEMEDQGGGLFSTSGEIQTIEDVSAALQGVEVETEADDDSDEEPLPRTDEELAPALFSLDDEETENIPETLLPPAEESLGIEGQLAEFFSDDSEPVPVVDDRIALKGLDVGTEEEKLDEGDVSSKEEFSPALYSLEKDTTEDLTSPSIFQEEPSFEVDEYSPPILADDSMQVSIEPEVEEDFLGVDIETEKAAEVEEQQLLVEEAEQDPALAEGEEKLLIDTEEKVSEEMLSVDFEDHLKEFFEVEGEETVIKEEPPEIDFSEALSETQKDIDSGTAETRFLADEEPSPALFEVDEGIFTPEEEATLTKETTDSDLSLVFEMEEEKTIPPETIAGADDLSLDLDEGSILKVGPEGETGDFLADTGKLESEPVFEKTEEVTSIEDIVEEPIFTAVTKEPSDTFSVLQDNEDFIEYIEGVEFDSEDEQLGSAIEPVGQTEDVVFEAADEEIISGVEREEDVTFDEIEEELEKYFTEQGDDLSVKPSREIAQPRKTEEFFKETETFGQSLEEGSVGSEIHMEMFQKAQDTEMSRISEELMAALSEETGKLPEERESQGKGIVVSESAFSLTADDDPLSRLRNCIASLGLEINDAILKSLFNEVNALQNLWISRPAEKTFLQLLSTVAQHIDHYRHDSSPEAHGLLMSVFDKLEFSRLAGVDKVDVQEGLLSETTKVLLWQQKMLTRKAMEQGEDFSAIFEAVDDRAEVDEVPSSQSFGQGRLHDHSYQKEGRTSGLTVESDVITKRSADVDTEKITRIVKDELAMLRQSFKSEMADLLQQYFDKDRSGKEDR